MERKYFALLLLTSAASAAHADWRVRAQGQVTTNISAGTTKFATDIGQKPAAVIDLFTDELFNDGVNYGYAYAKLKVTTEMGRIHAFGDAYATNNFYPGFDGGVAEFHTLNGNPSREVGDWYDQIHVTSSTLPFGTPVHYKVNVILEGSKSAYAPLGFNDTHAYLRAGFGSESAIVVMQDAFPVSSKTMMITTYVGDILPLYSSLEIQGYTGTTPGGPSTATVDAWNTGIFTIESLTPDTSFFTDSGYKYEAVPEPASFAALGIGALALLRRRRHRRNDCV